MARLQSLVMLEDCFRFSCEKIHVYINMYICINILPNHIESILSCLSYILICYSFYASVSGTGRAHRVERPELSGSVPPGIRLPNQLSLWRGWPLERGARRAARGWNTRNMGRAFLSAPKPRWRRGPVRFTGLVERRAESMDE